MSSMDINHLFGVKVRFRLVPALSAGRLGVDHIANT
jgi:hypothetical protein